MPLLRPDHELSSPEPETLGDHPVLNFLNTVSLVNGSPVDALQSDQDVAQWLDRFGWPITSDLHRQKKSRLLETARALRETTRSLIEKRKNGPRIDPTTLNHYLQFTRSHLELAAPKNGSLRLERRWKQRTAEEALAPLAESAADLLVNGDFNLIRRCESEECVRWFYDRTKSHRRRWCSMGLCGNRHKVAAYRKRQQGNN